jgi:CxxC motif-containing protein
MKKKITCITCPTGCDIEVTEKGGKYTFSGALCKAGEKYAEKELTAPERVICTSVKLKSTQLPLVSVRTSTPVPKGEIFDILKKLLDITVVAPVKRGDVIMKNISSNNADIIATKTVPC